MSMMAKYRVHEVAKDFKMNTKVITEILTKYSSAPKNHMQVLEGSELDLIFEYLTQHNQMESIAEVFAVPVAPKTPEKKAAQAGKAAQPQKGQQPAPKAQQSAAPQQQAQPRRQIRNQVGQIKKRRLRSCRSEACLAALLFFLFPCQTVIHQPESAGADPCFFKALLAQIHQMQLARDGNAFRRISGQKILFKPIAVIRYTVIQRDESVFVRYAHKRVDECIQSAPGVDYGMFVRRSSRDDSARFIDTGAIGAPP